MFAPNHIVKVAIVLYILLGGFVASSIWRHASAGDALQNTGIILAGLLPALVAVLPYLRDAGDHKEFSFVLFFDEQQRSLLTTELFSPYFLAYIDLLPASAPVPKVAEDEAPEVETAEGEAAEAETVEPETVEVAAKGVLEEKLRKLWGEPTEFWLAFRDEGGLDLIELGVLRKLIRTFYSEWDFASNTRSTPAGRVITHQGSGAEYLELRTAELHKVFTHNDLLDRWTYFATPRLKLPPGSRMTAEEDSSRRLRRISIQTGYGSTLAIEIQPNGGGIAPGGVRGLLEPSASLRTLEYDVRVSIKLPRWWGNSEETASHNRWFNNVAECLRQYDWEKVEKDVENELLRRSLVAPHPPGGQG